MPDFRFSDTHTHWAGICIDQLAAYDLVSGYPDGQFRPNASLTRAEYAALLKKAFPNAVPMRPAIQFGDVAVDYWAFEPIQTAYRTGFLSGYPDRLFRPAQPISRVQMWVALISGLRNRVARSSLDLSQYFDDAAQIPNYAQASIAAAVQQYLVVNYPNLRRLNPSQNATRGEVAALLCRALRLPGVPLQFVVGLDFIVVQPQFDQADAFAEGLARVQTNDRWGYINAQGQSVIAPQFTQASSFSDGLALIRTVEKIIEPET